MYKVIDRHVSTKYCEGMQCIYTNAVCCAGWSEHHPAIGCTHSTWQLLHNSVGVIIAPSLFLTVL